MKYFKDPENNVLYAYEADGSQDAFISEQLVAISDEEFFALQQEQIQPLTTEQIRLYKQAAYQTEADPLFFKMQRGEATREEWLAKVDEIKARFSQP